MIRPAAINEINGVRDKIISLRCLGHSYEAIAKTVGCKYATVKRVLDQEMKERFANREEIKNQTALQLDWLARPLMEKFEQTHDRKDAEVIIKIIDRKAKLLGLDEAVKVDIRQVESLTDEEIEKELAIRGIMIDTPKALPEATPAETIIDAEIIVTSKETIISPTPQFTSEDNNVERDKPQS